MVKKKYQLKSAGKNSLGYHEMLHQLSREVAAVKEANIKSQRDATAFKKLAPNS